jgi:hypothetical protein
MCIKSYAAVAANISTLDADVTRDSVMEKIAVNKETMASRIGMSVTKYKTTVAPVGMSEAADVPTMFATR